MGSGNFVTSLINTGALDFGTFIDDPGAEEAFDIANSQEYQFGETKVLVASVDTENGMTVTIGETLYQIPTVHAFVVMVLVSQIYSNFAKVIEVEGNQREVEFVEKLRKSLSPYIKES